VTYDGTIGALVELYQTNETSRYHELRYSAQAKYAYELGRIKKVLGDVRIEHITAERILTWQRQFLGPDRDHYVTAGRLIKRLRAIVQFGLLALPSTSGCPEVEKTFEALVKNRRLISGAGRREVAMTFDQATAFIAEARKRWPSIALATAFQFDCALRQKDLIGEWVPDVQSGGRTLWQMGIRWDEISTDLILRHKPSKSIKSPHSIVRARKKEPEEWDLSLCPLAMAELTALGVLVDGIALKAGLQGPMVICETTGVPWQEQEFRHRWRQVARRAGLPDEVQSRDARPGAASEAELAGVSLDNISATLAHADKRTTEIYTRRRRELRSKVQAQRVAFRQSLSTDQTD
jgi:integrase